LQQELNDYKEQEGRKHRQRSADAVEHQRKLDKQITEQVVSKITGANGMMTKELKLNKKLVDKIRNEIF